MTDCRKCLFYSEEYDKMKQTWNDVSVVGDNTDDRHFCEAFEPIPKGVFEGQKECKKFIPFNDE